MRFANRMVFELGLAIAVAWASSVSLVEAGVNVWTSNGPEGDVYALAIDPRTPSTLYAGTEEGGIFKSIDGGGHWSSVTSGLTRVRALAIDPRSPTIVYAGTYGTGIFKSTDGGGSWNPVNSGLPSGTLVNALVIDPLTPSTVYAGTDLGVFKSTDGGGHWGDAGLFLVWTLAIDPQTPNILYAGHPNSGLSAGISKTIDGGGHWSPVNSGLTNGDVRAVAIDPRSPTIVYAATYGGVFKSTNRGSSWFPIYHPHSSPFYALAIDPLTPTILYAGAGGRGVSKSTDGGGSWNAVNNGFHVNTWVWALAINPLSPSTLYAGLRSDLPEFMDRGVFVIQFTPSLAAAILPGSRSVQVGTPATAFATIINASPTAATACGISPATSVASTFLYQTTNPSTNALTGTPNTPVDIPAGGLQTYVFAFTPTAAFSPTDVQLSFHCTNTDAALIIPGVNTFLLSASTNPVPDIIALAATLSGDGIVNIPGADGTGLFVVATVNVGAGGQITASADTWTASLPVGVTVCQTNPTTSVCLAAPATSVTAQIDANATPTFAIFVEGHGVVPFDPANNRVFVRFTDGASVTRGATSVAVRTQ